VDADVLLRNVDYSVRHDWQPALVDAARRGHAPSNAIVLFATTCVQDEVERHLTDVARRRDVAIEFVVGIWNDVFLPLVRFVELKDDAISDPRVESVRALHENDAPTAALAIALGTCIVLTDNRRHFRPLGLPDVPTDETAIDLFALSQFLTGAHAAALLPALTGVAVVEGSRKAISMLGRRGAATVGLVLLGGTALWWLSESAGQFRETARTIGQDLGPKLAGAIENGVAAHERVSALAIESAEGPIPAFSLVARALANEPDGMSTAETSKLLREHGYRFSGTSSHRTQTRAWLQEQNCFFELQRGYWTLGYHAAALSVDDCLP
jgi:hypothetical protein